MSKTPLPPEPSAPPKKGDPILDSPEASWSDQAIEERAQLERELHELAAAGFTPDE